MNDCPQAVQNLKVPLRLCMQMMASLSSVSRFDSAYWGYKLQSRVTGDSLQGNKFSLHVAKSHSMLIST